MKQESGILKALYYLLGNVSITIKVLLASGFTGAIPKLPMEEISSSRFHSMRECSLDNVIYLQLRWWLILCGYLLLQFHNFLYGNNNYYTHYK